jgi:hypothetical protein
MMRPRRLKLLQYIETVECWKWGGGGWGGGGVGGGGW